tara:strand:- start:137 stop:640 length:504 start_codon:yes stop_codon:yes gene_type:complete
MKKLLLLLCGGVIFCQSASAAEVRNVITDSVQLTVNGSAVNTTRVGSSYSVTGSNVTVTTLGGLEHDDSAGAAATHTAGDYAVSGTGAFSFTETLTVGDDAFSTQAVDDTLGTFDSVNVYGTSTITAGGTKGSLAGTLSATAPPSVTAGGQGTTALGQRTVSLSVFE